MHASLWTLLFAIGASVIPARPVDAQSLLDRSPNLSGGWTGAPGVLNFHFLHRFTQSGAPAHKVTSSPTFFLAAGLPARTLVGIVYATNSQVVPNYPNEWAVFGRYAPLTEETGAPLDVRLQAGYNVAAESVDGELSLARRVGPVRLLAAGRALSDAFGTGESRFGVAGGATVRVSDHVALAGDVGSLLDRDEGEDLAWGVGVQIGLPYTPHTFSLHATNTNTATLQGASIGSDQVRYGFEFTIPVTLSRYFGTSEPVAATPPPPTRRVASPAGAAAGADTTTATIKNLAFAPAEIQVAPGTTVVWTNNDPLAHTVTADDGTFDSGNIEPGASWSHTFTEPGRYAYHCTPHPFMTAVVVVREP
ncbi:MAG TPA: cupredoxin family copper-binding protein [Longimicrobiales bacterium]